MCYTNIVSLSPVTNQSWFSSPFRSRDCNFAWVKRYAEHPGAERSFRWVQNTGRDLLCFFCGYSKVLARANKLWFHWCWSFGFPSKMRYWLTVLASTSFGRRNRKRSRRSFWVGYTLARRPQSSGVLWANHHRDEHNFARPSTCGVRRWKTGIVIDNNRGWQLVRFRAITKRVGCWKTIKHPHIWWFFCSKNK